MLARLLTTTGALALTAGAAAADYTLHIIHINDVHSRIQSINAFDSTCSDEDDEAGACFGGYARVATAINDLRAELDGENFIVVDAGDPFQGSLMYTTYKGAVEAEMMELVGFDVMAVGNHEFDDGPQGLADFIDAVSFPVISGNIDLTSEPLLNERVQDHVILDVGGERIGIISALAITTTETSSPGPNISFQNEAESLAADVAMLQEQGVTKIIAVNHTGFPLDQSLAETVDGIDAIVSSHSHTLMSNTEEGALPYPVMVGDVPVVQAYAYTKYIGHLTIVFDDDGNVTSATGDTILLDDSVAEDEAILARIDELAGPIEELMSTIVAEAGDTIDGTRESCRAVECSMGNLVADAMLDRVADQGVQIAIQNGGGLRASIGAGEVSMGDIIGVLPFQNTLSTFEVTGQDMIDALENGVGQVEDEAGRFPQVAGMSFVADLTAEPGSRISEVMVGDAPIDPEATYGVVSNNYVRQGGDGFEMFVNAGNAYDFGPDLAEVLADYLTLNSPYTPYTDGRITVR